MDTNKVDLWMMTNSKFFPEEKMPYIRDKVAALPPERIDQLYALNLKDPTTLTIVSVLLGEFGIDRFMVGDIGLCVAKLLTFGGCLVWWLIDIFLMGKRAKEVNYTHLMQVVGH